MYHRQQLRVWSARTQSPYQLGPLHPEYRYRKTEVGIFAVNPTLQSTACDSFPGSEPSRPLCRDLAIQPKQRRAIRCRKSHSMACLLGKSGISQ
jgi:hypothetical protein